MLEKSPIRFLAAEINAVSGTGRWHACELEWHDGWPKYNTKKIGASVSTLFADGLHVFDVVGFLALFCCFFRQPPQAINSLKDKSTATKLRVVVVQFRRSSPQSLLYWYFSTTVV